jgi:hypothetical protein
VIRSFEEAIVPKTLVWRVGPYGREVMYHSTRLNTLRKHIASGDKLDGDD